MRLSLLLLLIGLPWSLQSGDWMLSEGQQSLYLSQSLSEADSYWDDRRELRQDDCTSRNWRTTLHYEYGYSYYHTLFASAAFEHNQCGNDSAVGVPDIKLGLRGRVDPYRNGYTWELALVVPLKGDRLDRSKPGIGLFAIEAGLFRSYRDDPYEKPFTEPMRGIWGWELGTTLWAEGAGQELWGELNWRRQLSQHWHFKAWLGGNLSFNSDGGAAGDLFSSRKTIDYDRSALGARLSRQLARHTRLGLALEQTLWGRNTSQDTTLKLEFSRSWD